MEPHPHAAPVGRDGRPPRPMQRWLIVAACVLWLAVGALFAHLAAHSTFLRRYHWRLLAPAQSAPEPMPRWHVDRG